MVFRAFVCIILTVALFFALPLNCLAWQSRELSLSAKSAALIDAESGDILFAKNASARLPMASTTKIVTALVAAELLPSEQIIRIPREAVGIEGSSVYLCENELLTVEQLLYALLLESANDAAAALAIRASGSIEEFAKKCNEKAASLGLRDTNFTNPHGLYDENHYTTALDLALLTAEALKNPLIRKICASKTAKIPLGVTKEQPNGAGVRHLKNHNKMLSSYEGAIGVKTGFTKKSGRCLVSAAERDGLTLIAVTLNAPDDWRDHTAMLDFGFENYEARTIFGAGEFCYDFPVSNGEALYVRAKNVSPIKITVKKDAPPHTANVEACFRFAVAPVTKGQILGKVIVRIEGKTLSSSLVAVSSVAKLKHKPSFFD